MKNNVYYQLVMFHIQPLHKTRKLLNNLKIFMWLKAFCSPENVFSGNKEQVPKLIDLFWSGEWRITWVYIRHLIKSI